jgi:hypothetical protein
MGKVVVCINFYGHADAAIAGKPASAAPFGAIFRSAARTFQRDLTLKVVSGERIGCPNLPGKKVGVVDYNAALGEGANKELAKSVLTGEIAACSDDDWFYLVTGYSSGGVSALHTARRINELKLNLYYVGLSDAAFQRGESDYLLTQPGVTAKYKKNYYQTKENDPVVSEIHNAVTGFSNFNLDDQLAAGVNAHQSAVTIGNQRMYEDVKWCIQNC